MKYQLERLLALAAVFSFVVASQAEVLIATNSAWRFLKGTAEASAPIPAWRTVDFDNSSWPAGSAPFHYGENIAIGTELADMRNRYGCVFLRKNFTIDNPQTISELAFRALCDDGFVAWINGVEVARYNMPAGEPEVSSLAVAAVAEPVSFASYPVSSPQTLLHAGTNVLAIQVFNNSLTSSDLQFNLELTSTTPDTQAPVIASIDPLPGTVGQLAEVTVTFSEPVQGVGFSDLLINGRAATAVRGSGVSYVFSFDPAPEGRTVMSWDVDSQITDLASPANRFDTASPQARWEYAVVDAVAPALQSIAPQIQTTVRQLTQVEVIFTEPVTGVEATDLLINGIPAATVTGSDLRYTFQFSSPAPGPVHLAWAANHAISDLADRPNAFAGGSWEYVLDPDFAPPKIRINEFLASNLSASGLRDEDGELQDWIELYNQATNSVNLAGWSLTDDAGDPGRWVFPDISMAPGSFLVVFASGKDHRTTQPGARMHTNFQLNPAGEYLGLYNNESPRVAVSEFQGGYPEQRNNYSFGYDDSGALRYFNAPSPGTPNGSSAVSGVTPKPHFSVARGFFDAPFKLLLTCIEPGAVIRYTTDGSEPTMESGQTYTTPLTVSATTIFRAIALKATLLPSITETHSYIFPDQVLRQPNNPPGYPVGSTVWGGYPSDYEMDPEIVTNAAYKDFVKDALLALPTLSVVCNKEDMFDATRGIYTHPLQRGPSWEKPCSVELMLPDGAPGFQIDAGVQIQGNAAREPQKQPKHPMRLSFKGAYGPTHLNYPLFPDSPVSEFDTLVLRADFNISWLHWDPNQRIRAQRTRDAWMKDSMRAMGGLATHNRYVHLYINGIYWGIYDPSERPDAAFAASYLGGGKEDYDVVNEGAAVDGTMTSYNAMLKITNLAQDSAYEAMKQYLDMPQFIDYTLLHFYVGHEDWGENKNWYTMRRRDGTNGFKYVPWDGEMILNSPTINRVSNPDVPSGLHTKLMASAQYRMDFADRVQKHLFNDGALTPQATADRWMKRAHEVDLPMIVESARWGDYRRDVHPYQAGPYELYTRNNQWLTEQGRLLTQYFPQRTGTVLNQLRAAGLYPSVAAPSLSQNGGQVSRGFALTVSAPQGVIYYTVDGSDPRVYGAGIIATTANTFQTPVVLNNNIRIKARVLFQDNWSALTEAEFKVEDLGSPLRVTEIMYNPPGGDSYEFLEIQNTSSTRLDVSGYSLEGIHFVFPHGTFLEPGELTVLASGLSPAAFATRYPGVVVGGYFDGSLSNGGEQIGILEPSGRRVVSVSYRDKEGWPETADGLGASLELIDPAGDPNSPASWQSSATLYGSPGKPPKAPAAGTIWVNEIFAGGSTPDWIELHNRGDSVIDLANWSLTDGGNARKFVFSNATSITPGGYVTVWCDAQTNAPGLHTSFALKQEGETIFLYDANTNRADAVTFGMQAADYSLARIGADGQWELGAPTFNAENRSAETGLTTSLRINEWASNPEPGAEDWIELYNLDASRPVSLSGLYLAATNRLSQLRAPAFLGPHGYALLHADEGSGPDHLNFKLPSSGSFIDLYDPSGVLLDRVTYSQQSEGTSLGRLPDGQPEIVSFFETKSPGEANYQPATDGLHVNEVMARNDSSIRDSSGRFADWIEIYNPNSGRLDMGGMHLSTRASDPGWTFPTNSMIDSQGYLIVWFDKSRPESSQFETDLNAGFQLDGDGDTIVLRDAQDRVNDVLAYGPQIADQSIGRIDQGWLLMATPTPGRENSVKAELGQIEQIRINEWMAAAPDGNDWFELYNISSLPVALDHSYFSDDPSLSGKVRFQVPPLSFIAGHGWTKWIADGNPSNGASHVNFSFDDLGETIRIYSADTNLVDAVDFGIQMAGISEGRLTDGGAEIGRLQTASPGRSNVDPGLTDRDGDGIPDDWELRYGLNPDSAVDASQDADEDGASNLTEYLSGTDPRNPGSRFGIESVTADGGTLTFRFSATPGISYTIEYRDSFNDNWKPFKTIVAAADTGSIVVQDSISGIATQRFYRITIPMH